MKKTKFIAYLIPILILYSCTTLPESTLYQSFDEVSTFEMQGRAAVKSPDFNGQLSLNLKEPKREHYHLVMQGSLGIGRTELTVAPHETKLISAERTYIGANPDQLFYEITEIDWPVSGTLAWIKGSPNNSETEILYNTDNLPRSFYEDGWLVEYDRWQTVQGLSLPERMTISRDNTRLRLSLERWRLY